MEQKVNFEKFVIATVPFASVLLLAIRNSRQRSMFNGIKTSATKTEFTTYFLAESFRTGTGLLYATPNRPKNPFATLTTNYLPTQCSCIK